MSAVTVIAYIGFIEWLIGWESLLWQWRTLGFLSTVVAVALMLMSYLLRTWRVYDYFQKETAGNFAILFRIIQVHNILNIMLPFRAGEISFPALMKAEFGISFARATSALLVMRLLDLHGLLVAGTLGLVIEHGLFPVAWFAWILFLLLPAAGYASKTRIFRLIAALPPSRLRMLAAEFESGLPANAYLFVRAWIVTLVNWLTKVAMLATVLGFLGVEPLAAAFGGALGGEFSSVLPIHAPGGVGTYPAAITVGALAFGAAEMPGPRESLSRASVNLHVLIIFAALVAVGVSLLVERAWNLLRSLQSE